MPFARNADLPGAVRRSLPSAAQTQWRRVFNAEDERGRSDARAAASAWAALREAGWRPPPADAPPGAKWRRIEKAETDYEDDDDEPKRRRRRRATRARDGQESASTARALPNNKKRVKKPAMGRSFTASTAEVVKVDEELGVVIGWAIVCTEKGERYFDVQGDHIPEDAMLKAAVEFMAESRAAKEMHAGDVVGDSWVFPLTGDIAKSLGLTTEKTGLLVMMRPRTEAMLAKFRDGTYTGFSIGGRRIEDEEVD